MRRFATLAVILAALAVAATARPDAHRAARCGPAHASGRAAPRFSHAVLVVFENREFRQVIGNPSAPTFNRLARRYALLRRYCAVSHPSLPNYLALVSGTTGGVASDCPHCRVDAPNLADTLAAAHRTWKTYAESLPAPGFSGANSAGYTKSRDPFLHFRDVLSSPARVARVVPLTELGRDLAARRLPDFSLVVPDLCHGAHGCPIATGDRWLRQLLPKLLHSRQMKRGVVFVVFDEGRTSDTKGGGGHVPALVLGPMVRPRARSNAPLTHYSLLRTIEQSWGLPYLGNSASASPISGIWRSRRLSPSSHPGAGP